MPPPRIKASAQHRPAPILFTHQNLPMPAGSAIGCWIRRSSSPARSCRIYCIVWMRRKNPNPLRPCGIISTRCRRQWAGSCHDWQPCRGQETVPLPWLCPLPRSGCETTAATFPSANSAPSTRTPTSSNFCAIPPQPPRRSHAAHAHERTGSGASLRLLARSPRAARSLRPEPRIRCPQAPAGRC